MLDEVLEGEELEFAKNVVKTFLSRPTLLTHFVKRPCKYEADLETHRIVPRSKPAVSYGRFDLRTNTVSMLCDNICEPASRGMAFRTWLGYELAAYKRELEGKGSPAPTKKIEVTLASLFAESGIDSAQPTEFGATEREYAIGDWCKANFKKGIEMVSLKVSSVSFTDAEISAIYIAIDAVQNMYEEDIATHNLKVKSINYGKGLVVKPGKTEVKGGNIPFEPSLVNIKPDAHSFIDRVDAILSKPKNEQPKCITALFHGAPGTSKTALGQHLADHLGIQLIKKTYSDIQDKYVSEGEKRLADIFDEAQANNAILMIDEIDSIAGNRALADKDHVRTMTNQLLTSMDEYEGIIIGTTNFVKHLDPAAIRRFFLKIQFDYLTREQQQLALKKFFPKKYRGKELPDIKFLTVGDFKAVKERSLYEPEVPDFERVVSMLREEVALKIKTTPELFEASKRSIGFHS